MENILSAIDRHPDAAAGLGLFIIVLVAFLASIKSGKNHE